MSTSPRTCAPACQPLHPPQKGLQPSPYSPGATTRAAFANRPSAVMRLKLFHSISRELSSISRTYAPSCQPLHPPQKGLQPGLCPPGATTRAAFDSHPSAVMRPKLFCPISRELSSISRTRAHTCATPPSAAEGPPARPVLARRRDARGLRQPPVCRHAPKTFFAQSLVNARTSLVRSLLPINPSIRRKRASSAARASPPRQPCCAQNFLPNLTQSLVISRRTLVHLSCLSTPSTAATKLPI